MTVYLIHFCRPLGDPANPRGQAQHYLGSTDDLPARLETHRRGNGSRIMAAIHDAGIDWLLVRTWPGDRKLERRLKQCKNAARFCPVCNPETWLNHGYYFEDYKNA